MRPRKPGHLLCRRCWHLALALKLANPLLVSLAGIYYQSVGLPLWPVLAGWKLKALGHRKLALIGMDLWLTPMGRHECQQKKDDVRSYWRKILQDALQAPCRLRLCGQEQLLSLGQIQ